MDATQLAALKSEIQTDPAKLGYAAYIGVSDNQLAAMLNATTGTGAATISLSTVTKGALLLGIIPWLDQIASGKTLAGATLTADVITKWQQRAQVLQAADATIVVVQVAPMMAEAITDGIGTQAQIDAVAKRTGSRAEVLFGEGTTIQAADVLAAMGS